MRSKYFGENLTYITKIRDLKLIQRKSENNLKIHFFLSSDQRSDNVAFFLVTINIFSKLKAFKNSKIYKCPELKNRFYNK